MGAIAKNVLEYTGNVLTINPNLVFNNIEVLKEYGIPLTNDANNNGYTLLGMSDLSDKLDLLIEKGIWNKKEESNLDLLDLIRGYFIKLTYTTCKNKDTYDKIVNVRQEDKDFSTEKYSDERIEQVYLDHNQIKSIIDKLDSEYQTSDGIYSVGVNAISKQRVLRNLCNYRGKGNDTQMFEAALTYKSSVSNTDEVVNHLVPLLEMGEDSVKLSQRI